MPNDKKLLDNPLSDLIKKFSEEDVIVAMEKEYQSAPAKLVPTSLIDDTSFLTSVVLPDATVDYFASGLKEKGFYNPLVVRPVGDRFEVILGRKRFFGAKKAGILSLPCAIVEVGDEEELLMLLADTRDQRESNVVAMALICKELSSTFHYTQQTLANLSHQSRSQITNTMRILRLPSSVQEEICLGTLSYGHAKSIASLPEEEIIPMVDRIHSEGLSVREIEGIVKEKNGEDSAKTEQVLRKYRAKKVEITKTGVQIKFDSEEDRDVFLTKILSTR